MQPLQVLVQPLLLFVVALASVIVLWLRKVEVLPDEKVSRSICCELLLSVYCSFGDEFIFCSRYAISETRASLTLAFAENEDLFAIM